MVDIARMMCPQAHVANMFLKSVQVDYLRAVGPGVYVGIGWKQPDSAEAKRFLYFMLVKRCDDTK